MPSLALPATIFSREGRWCEARCCPQAALLRETLCRARASSCRPRRPLVFASEGVQGPVVLLRMVTEDVEVVVIGADLEALVARPVPLVENLFYLVRAAGAKREAKRPLVGPVAGVAFDF